MSYKMRMLTVGELKRGMLVCEPVRYGGYWMWVVGSCTPNQSRRLVEVKYRMLDASDYHTLHTRSMRTGTRIRVVEPSEAICE